MTRTDFAEIVHQPVSFSSTVPAEQLILRLIDTPWVQRLRDISQTANTKLVYMFSEHSRFGHSLGVAYLACTLAEKLKSQKREEVESYRMAVCAAALLHDLGHLAPGSHTAAKIWFPDAPDKHEAIGMRIIEQDSIISEILEDAQPGLISLVKEILNESNSLPAWTWQIISGGSWNVDRGNWCVVDSILAGVSYGRYNVGALIDSFLITEDGQLALRENRIDAMVHFAVSRHAMYRQVYQHRVILAADTLNRAIASRARDLGDKLGFADGTMRAVLEAKDSSELSLDSVFEMRESWWRYHLQKWSKDLDPILADLSLRSLNRVLFKTIRRKKSDVALLEKAKKVVKAKGFAPEYYLHSVSTTDMLSSDYHQPMLVQMDDGSLIPVTEADPLLASLGKEALQTSKEWLVMPWEAKQEFVK